MTLLRYNGGKKYCISTLLCRPRNSTTSLAHPETLGIEGSSSILCCYVLWRQLPSLLFEGIAMRRAVSLVTSASYLVLPRGRELEVLPYSVLLANRYGCRA